VAPAVATLGLLKFSLQIFVAFQQPAGIQLMQGMVELKVERCFSFTFHWSAGFWGNDVC